MIAAIHQPHFLPWLGYLHRMACADVFVLLDHVQFERRNYQNRTMIRLDGEPRWLTVPVLQRSQKERIIDKSVDNGSGSARPLQIAHTEHECARGCQMFQDAQCLARWVLAVRIQGERELRSELAGAAEPRSERGALAAIHRMHQHLCAGSRGATPRVVGRSIVDHQDTRWVATLFAP